MGIIKHIFESIKKFIIYILIKTVIFLCVLIAIILPLAFFIYQNEVFFLQEQGFHIDAGFYWFGKYYDIFNLQIPKTYVAIQYVGLFFAGLFITYCYNLLFRFKTVRKTRNFNFKIKSYLSKLAEREKEINLLRSELTSTRSRLYRIEREMREGEIESPSSNKELIQNGTEEPIKEDVTNK